MKAGDNGCKKQRSQVLQTAASEKRFPLSIPCQTCPITGTIDD
ncbi:hypothetical protein SD77_2151 [Bacillus badius]|uniref:Ribose 5-phosphate isomerase B n=1 Tax=Bacillus badius TaxID=1455 RepID=A0ABR5AY87_BACBA|nr:hypothetical protein SD78_2383 [Bacillus badius]KIL79697.1 hypothetical protein SD77_2151 [Bacillus badius]